MPKGYWRQVYDKSVELMNQNKRKIEAAQHQNHWDRIFENYPITPIPGHLDGDTAFRMARNIIDIESGGLPIGS